MTMFAPRVIPDFASIAAQDHAKRALEVAATGGHSLALTGAPGNGKTVLARALAALLPPFEQEIPRPIIAEHDAMAWVEEALTGQTGYLSRAQHGVLLLDRLDCFVYSPPQIQRLGVVIDRVSDVQLVITQQPCPCGFYGDPLRECVCPPRWLLHHQLRMRALMERVSIAVDIPRPESYRLMDVRSPESSATVAARVRAGAARQQARFAGQPLSRNAEMDHAQILQFCQLEASAEKLYKAACQQLHVSVRSADNVLAVARTIADLADSAQIQANHLAEAIQYQPRS